MQLCHVDRPAFAQLGHDHAVFSLLSDLSRFYPDIERWSASKVLPGLLDDTRKILVEHDASGVRGFAILKRDVVERKICTIWVRPDLRCQGLGQSLITQSQEWLQCVRPMLTVPEEALSTFRGLLASSDFRLNEVVEGYYRPGKKEYVFNGVLPSASARAALQ